MRLTLNFIPLVEKHPMYSNLWKKLSKDEMNFTIQFIIKTENDSNDDYMHKVNRIFLTEKKSKHWTIIQDILTACK